MARVPFGVRGVDDILEGGLPGQRLFLLSGDPGTGKTTLALQFLLEGERRGETGLYVTLSETAEELNASAASHGWSLDKLTVYELSSMEQASGLPAAQTLFHPSEVELNETTKGVLDIVERMRPQRVHARVEGCIRALCRFGGEHAGYVRRAEQITGLEQCGERIGGRELRAVEERQTFLGAQHERL
jgi:KaiC/GvpD/RAD55 family RecA-like ATPase